MSSSSPDPWYSSFRDDLRRHEDERKVAFAGRYELQEELGRGAMGVVYRALDRELDRIVAVKILLEGAQLDEDATVRFLREARTMAGFSHPHVVAVHDVGESSGQSYLVMERVEGVSLAKLLADGAAASRDLIAILAKAARGIGAVHARGIVHRDVKPSNILVNPAGEPKVGDFGLASKAASSSGITATGTILGTPPYMAPEQIDARRGDVTVRTDVYALGAVLYRILTGRLPHPHARIAELLNAILNDNVVPPRLGQPAIHPDIESVCLKALSKSPDLRYADATAFAEDLQRWLDGQPVVATPVRAKTRPAVRMAGMVLVVAVIVAVVKLATAKPAPEAPPAAVSNRALALLEEARPILDRAAAYLYTADARYEELAKRVQPALQLIERAVDENPELALGHHLLGRAWSLAGWPDKAEASWIEAVRRDPQFGPAHYHLGRLSLDRWYMASSGYERDFSLADRAARTGAEHMKRALASGARLDSDLVKRMAEILAVLCTGELEKVRPVVEAAIRECDGQDGIEDLHWIHGLCLKGPPRMAAYGRAIERMPKHAMARMSRAIDLMEAGDSAGAIADLDEVLAISPRAYDAWMDRGDCRVKLNQPVDAIADFTGALEIRPRDAAALANRAIANRMLGKVEAALRDCDSAIAARPRFGMAHQTRANIFRSLRRFPEALRDYTEAISLDPNYADAYRGRGGIRCELGSHAEALEDFLQMVRLRPGSPEPFLLCSWARASMGDVDGALADAQRVLDLEPRNPKAFMMRGNAYRKAGDRAAAAAEYRKALSMAPEDWPDRGLVEMLLREVER